MLDNPDIGVNPPFPLPVLYTCPLLPSASPYAAPSKTPRYGTKFIAELIVQLVNVWVVVTEGATMFCACIVNDVYVPAVVGVPPSTPLGDSEIPGGNVPEVNAKPVDDALLTLNVTRND